jgi:endonuclease/exonuclease/phosphatase family metal-dependent hydrolase
MTSPKRRFRNTLVDYGVLVRTWNVFHGNTEPPQRRAFLEEMVRLAVADRPALVCLQEVPPWAFRHLGDWSGMAAVADVAARPLLGSAELGRAITELDHGLFRSFLTGQGNAILVAEALRVIEHETIVLNPRAFRRTQARSLDLGPVARVAWARERRICQAVRVRRESGESLVVANLHATNYPRDPRLPDAELLRAATFVDAVATPHEAIVLAGDFNVSVARSRTLHALRSPEWTFEGPTPAGLDHVLVRGLDAGAALRWPADRRTTEHGVLSDHAPVDREVA